MTVFWKYYSAGEDNCSTLENNSSILVCWGLYWTSFRGCWIRLRFMHDLFLYMICKMNVNAWIYQFMHFVGIKLGFRNALSWIAVTPWNNFFCCEKLWFLLFRQAGFNEDFLLLEENPLQTCFRLQWSRKCPTSCEPDALMRFMKM